MTEKQHGRRLDDMTADEVKQFWHGFCERKKVDAATQARGDKKIDEDRWQLLRAARRSPRGSGRGLRARRARGPDPRSC